MATSGGVLAGIGEGLLAGAIGTAGMTLVQTKVVNRIPAGETKRKPSWPKEPEAKNEGPTETLARRIVTGLAGRRLTRRQKERLGMVVHYGTGAVSGAVVAAFDRRPTPLRGLLWGSAVWMVNDNILLPLLRLAGWPHQYAPGVHARALGAHLAWGLATATVLQALGRGLPRRRRSRLQRLLGR